MLKMLLVPNIEKKLFVTLTYLVIQAGQGQNFHQKLESPDLIDQTPYKIRTQKQHESCELFVFLFF